MPPKQSDPQPRHSGRFAHPVGMTTQDSTAQRVASWGGNGALEEEGRALIEIQQSKTVATTRLGMEGEPRLKPFLDNIVFVRPLCPIKIIITQK